MRKLLSLIALVCSPAFTVSAQTQHGRIVTDMIANTGALPISGSTPSVTNGNLFVTNNAVPILMTNFAGGVDSQRIGVVCGDSNTTIVNGSGIYLATGANFVCTPKAEIEFVYVASLSQWIQSSGSASVASGAQVNVVNTFTATQNFDADFHTKGPNPYFDLARYGASTSTQTAVCSINAGSTTLSCTSNPDFQNGQGVMIPLAGDGPTDIPSAPSVSSVVPVNVTNGSTQEDYEFVLENYSGALTAAGTSGQTLTSAATIGLQSPISLTGMVRASGIDTYTCATNCNVQAGAHIQISGFSNGAGSLVNGTLTVYTIPSPTTFTVLADGMPDYTESASATMSVRACNDTFPGGTLAIESKILRAWIYRRDGGSGSFNRVGVAPGQDPYYRDCGVGASAPSYVPATAPTVSQPGYLTTTIVSGGGSNTMIVANAAITTATNVTIKHDNTPALLAAWAAALGSHGGVVRVPIVSGGTGVYSFNSTIDLTNVPNPTFSTARLEFQSMTLNQPLILPQATELVGIPYSTTSFVYVPVGTITGAAQPFILLNSRSHNSIIMRKFNFLPTVTGQSDVVADEFLTNGGVTGIRFEDVGLASNSASAAIIKGGFDHYFLGGACGVLGAEAGLWYSSPCVRFPSSSTYVVASGAQIAGRIYFEKWNVSGGTGVQMDNLPNPANSSGCGNLFMDRVLHESMAGPPLRLIETGSSFCYGFSFFDVSTADIANGAHTPLFESTNANNFTEVVFNNNKGFTGEPMMLSAVTTATPICTSNVFFVGCGPSPNSIFGRGGNGSVSTIDGGEMQATNGGSIGYVLPTPAAPSSCVVSAGGSVPVGNWSYMIVATDRPVVSFSPTYSGVTVPGPVCNVTTTSGNQTVTITRPTLPSGATGWLVWRAVTGTGTGAEINIPPDCLHPISRATVSFVDSSSFTCGVSASSVNSAFLTGINSSGINTNQLFLGGEGFTASPRAEHSIFLPGALTTTWTAASWTLDKAITVTRVQVQMKTAPSGCSPNAIVRLSDGTNNVDVTVSAGANDSGAISQAFAAAAVLTTSVQTAAAGCGTSPSDANVIVQYKMQ